VNSSSRPIKGAWVAGHGPILAPSGPQASQRQLEVEEHEFFDRFSP